VINQYLADLRTAVQYASEHREASAKGNAAIYGLMARIPFRSMVEKSVRKIMIDLYGESTLTDEEIAGKQQQSIVQSPAWMGTLNRFLSAWSRWKRVFQARNRSRPDA
jgi:hypothetical protein